MSSKASTRITRGTIQVSPNLAILLLNELENARKTTTPLVCHVDRKTFNTLLRKAKSEIPALREKLGHDHPIEKVLGALA